MAKKMSKYKVTHPPIPRMPSGLDRQKKLKLQKRRADRSGTVSRSRYETDKASKPT